MYQVPSMKVGVTAQTSERLFIPRQKQQQQSGSKFPVVRAQVGEVGFSEITLSNFTRDSGDMEVKCLAVSPMYTNDYPKKRCREKM